MRLLDRIFRRAREVRYIATHFIGSLLGQVGSVSSWDYENYAKQGYLRNATVRACIDQIAGALTNIDFDIQDGDKELITIPAALKPLNKLLTRPNPNQGWDALLQEMAVHMSLAGVAYLQLTAAGETQIGGTVRKSTNPELWLIRPDLVTVKYTGRHVDGYKVQGIATPFTRDEVLQLVYVDPLQQFGGASPIKSVENVIDSSNRATDWNANLLKNSARPDAVLGVKGVFNLTGDERTKIKEDYEKALGGSDKAGGLVVLEADGYDYKQLSLSPSEMSWLEGLMYDKREIAAAFKVPGLMVGDPESSTYANYKEARKAFYVETILPLANYIAGELNNWLVPKYSKTAKIVLGTESIGELQDDKNEENLRRWRSNWLTQDEKRVAENLPPVGGQAAEVPVAPGQMQLVMVRDFPAPTATESRSQHATHITALGAGGAMPRADAMRETPPVTSLRITRLFTTRASLEADYRKLQDEFERKYTKVIDKYLQGQVQRVAKKLKKQLKRSVLGIEERIAKSSILNEHTELEIYAEVVEPIALEALFEFGQLALDELGAGGEFDIERPGLQKRLAADLAKRSKLITNTTANEIKDVLTKATSEGVGTDETARRLQESLEGLPERRAGAIARTETNRAASGATLEGYEQGGVKKKRWVTNLDGKERESHRAANGQVQKLDANFKVGSDVMQAPGHGSVASENVNCRCRIAPVVR